MSRLGILHIEQPYILSAQRLVGCNGHIYAACYRFIPVITITKQVGV